MPFIQNPQKWHFFLHIYIFFRTFAAQSRAIGLQTYYKKRLLALVLVI